ncbi:hypothetical protein ASPTUDRAFT_581826 [Aspergillus terreus]|uniref:Uncharacterized protein n=1 Tax=Aspergillus terreus TaxID=33178 RepID=A0A5M3ZCJ3_ASPTE|nr:hypothetical protein ATETN484_0014029100 [Aspergillus terreus]GFF20957.1 hypothetical protein ASPTUDRAFT_581826 [Aspergillus terreus]
MSAFSGLPKNLEVLGGLQPGAKDDKPRRIDVRPVRLGLITWLIAVIGVPPAVNVDARSARLHLRADFGHKARITAIRMIAKAHHEPQPIKAAMDEAATAIAWVKEFPDKELRRVLISQDDASVSLTFPKFDVTWTKYIECGTQHAAGVMEMVKYGPWDIRVAEHTEELAIIVLALAHEA